MQKKEALVFIYWLEHGEASGIFQEEGVVAEIVSVPRLGIDDDPIRDEEEPLATDKRGEPVATHDTPTARRGYAVCRVAVSRGTT